MKLTALLFLCLGTGVLAETNAVINEIDTAYRLIEAEFENWSHYTLSNAEVEGGFNIRRDVWLSPEGDGYAKVTVRGVDDYGETGTEYYIRGEELLFALEKKSNTPLVEGALTQGLRMNNAEEFETEVGIERGSAAFAAQAQLAGMISQDFHR